MAEELAQEVFLRVYRARDGYEPTAKFTTWLYRIATRLALNSIRDRKPERNQRSLDDSESAARRPSSRRSTDARRASRSCWPRPGCPPCARRSSLPEKQRAAVLMHKYEELDYQQIAGALDCSVSAVKSLLFRAYETADGAGAAGPGRKEGPGGMR
ncbi:MAG: RNA polymerase sigma factor [Bryobacterales bacterium]